MKSLFGMGYLVGLRGSGSVVAPDSYTASDARIFEDGYQAGAWDKENLDPEDTEDSDCHLCGETVPRTLLYDNSTDADADPADEVYACPDCRGVK